MKKRNGQKKELQKKYCNKNDKGSKVYFVVDLVDGQQPWNMAAGALI